MKKKQTSIPQRILVTGASGFVGGHLIQHLTRSTEAKIWAVYRSDSDKQSNPRIKWIKQDLFQNIKREAFPDKVDLIFHCASPMGEHADPRELFSVNVRATLNLLDYAVRSKTRNFVYISSGGVAGFHREAITEDSTLDPSSPYLKAKAGGEFAVQTFGGHLCGVIIRLFFPYGCGQQKGLIPTLCRNLFSGKPVYIDSDGGPRINPIHIEDAVNQISIIAMGENKERIFNVAGSELIRMTDLIENLRKQLAVEAKIQVRKDVNRYLVGTTQRFRRQYATNCQVDLESGLSRFVDFWQRGTI